MRHFLGSLALIGSILFALAMLAGMVCIAWLSSDEISISGNAVFFGFGIPMMALGGAVYSLWLDDDRYLRFLGWTATFVGLAWAVGLLFYVASWTGLLGQLGTGMRGSGIAPFMFLGFFLAMFATGGAGILLLVSPEELMRSRTSSVVRRGGTSFKSDS